MHSKYGQLEQLAIVGLACVVKNTKPLHRYMYSVQDLPIIIIRYRGPLYYLFPMLISFTGDLR